MSDEPSGIRSLFGRPSFVVPGRDIAFDRNPQSALEAMAALSLRPIDGPTGHEHLSAGALVGVYESIQQTIAHGGEEPSDRLFALRRLAIEEARRRVEKGGR